MSERALWVVPLVGMPEVRPGDDLARLLLEAVGRAGLELADAFVLDAVDADQAAEVAALGLEPVVVPTLMRTVEDAAGLAKAALEAL